MDKKFVVEALAELKPVEFPIRATGETADHFLLGGYGHVWGDVTQKDLYGEYFTPQSDLVPSLAPVKLIFFDHALFYGPDGEPFDHALGKAAEENTFTDDVGKWVAAVLDKREKYVDEVMELVDLKALGWSSGSVYHLVKTRRDGWMERWPVVEYSLTPTPAEPRIGNVVQVDDVGPIRAAYKAAGLRFVLERGEVEAEVEAEGLESEGGDDGRAERVARARLQLLKMRR